MSLPPPRYSLAAPLVAIAIIVLLSILPRHIGRPIGLAVMVVCGVVGFVTIVIDLLGRRNR